MANHKKKNIKSVIMDEEDVVSNGLALLGALLNSIKDTKAPIRDTDERLEFFIKGVRKGIEASAVLAHQMSKGKVKGVTVKLPLTRTGKSWRLKAK